MDATAELCDARAGPDGTLYCDLKLGHGGGRHKERYAATWARDGSDVRWFDESAGRYRPASASEPTR